MTPEHENGINVIKERLMNFIEDTKDWRDEFMQRIRHIEEKLMDLPCKERSAFYKSITSQLRFLWGFVSAIMLILVAELFKHFF